MNSKNNDINNNLNYINDINKKLYQNLLKKILIK